MAKKSVKKSAETWLKQVGTTVGAIKSIAERLHVENAMVIDGNQELKTTYEELKNQIAEVEENLRDPRLSIAMVGTTSAGKSTIVNGLAGRKIAPMEAKEMSAGVLVLKPGDNVSVSIVADAKYYKGQTEIKNTTDGEAYGVIKGIFEAYHNHKGIVVAPRITVTGPLLWSQSRDKIGLPEVCSFEFIDLPGIKATGDHKNLEVVKKYLSRALCVIAIDYQDVDDQRVGRLMEEIVQVCQTLGGFNKKSYLFLMNKVNRRTVTDGELQAKIDDLKGKIREKLNLGGETDVKIIPYDAYLQYLAQMAIKSDGTVDNEIVDALFKEYGSKHFTKRSGASDDVSAANAKFDNGTELTKEDVLPVVEYSKAKSGVADLTLSLRVRIENSFYDVVVRPMLSGLLLSIRELCEKLKVYVGIAEVRDVQKLWTYRLSILSKQVEMLGCPDDSKAATQEQLGRITTWLEESRGAISDGVYSQLSQKLQNLRQRIESGTQGKISETQGKITADIEGFRNVLIEYAQSNNRAAVSERVEELNGELRMLADSVIEVPRGIIERLDFDVVDVVVDCLDKEEGKETCGFRLGEKLSRKLYGEMLDSYENILKLFEEIEWDLAKAGKLFRHENYWVYASDTQMNEEDLNRYKRTYDVFNRRMREVFVNYANFLFELDGDKIIAGLEVYLEGMKTAILEAVSKGDLEVSVQDVFNSIVSSAVDRISLPEELFSFAEYEEKVRAEVVTVYAGERVTKVGICCDDTEPVYIDTDKMRYTHSFPTVKKLKENWKAGFDEARNVLPNVISKWVIEVCRGRLCEYNGAVEKVVNLVELWLTERINAIEQTRPATDLIRECISILEGKREELLSNQN